MSDRAESPALIERLVARLVAWIDANTIEVENVPDALPKEEFPECPYCEKRLGIGIAPTHGPAWKCPRHGTFTSTEVDENVLRGMQTVVSK